MRWIEEKPGTDPAYVWHGPDIDTDEGLEEYTKYWFDPVFQSPETWDYDKNEAIEVEEEEQTDNEDEYNIDDDQDVTLALLHAPVDTFDQNFEGANMPWGDYCEHYNVDPMIMVTEA